MHVNEFFNISDGDWWRLSFTFEQADLKRKLAGYSNELMKFINERVIRFEKSSFEHVVFTGGMSRCKLFRHAMRSTASEVS